MWCGDVDDSDDDSKCCRCVSLHRRVIYLLVLYWLVDAISASSRSGCHLLNLVGPQRPQHSQHPCCLSRVLEASSLVPRVFKIIISKNPPLSHHPSHRTLAAMAIARPIRALALAAIVLWCFFIYVLISPKSTKYPLGPGDKTGYKHIKEPLLEGMCAPFAQCFGGTWLC